MSAISVICWSHVLASKVSQAFVAYTVINLLITHASKLNESVVHKLVYLFLLVINLAVASEFSYMLVINYVRPCCLFIGNTWY